MQKVGSSENYEWQNPQTTRIWIDQNGHPNILRPKQVWFPKHVVNWAVLNTQKRGKWPWVVGRKQSSVQLVGFASEVHPNPYKGIGSSVLGDDHFQPCTPHASTEKVNVITQLFVTFTQLTAPLFQLPYLSHSCPILSLNSFFLTQLIGPTSSQGGWTRWEHWSFSARYTQKLSWFRGRVLRSKL